MTSDVADFRSDTLTLPDQAMRSAMAAAEVGDDVFGEDVTVRALEQEAALVLGMEAALFTPSGTMANQIAIHVHCRPGDELLCEQRSHIFLYEGGGAARFSGVQVRPLVAPSGFPDPADIAAAIRADDPHFPRSRLLVLENSHNMAGGRVLLPDALAELVSAAKALSLKVHVDGARLCNAAVAAGCPVTALTRGLDSVSLCLSKGLGAPVGSVLAGSAAFIHQARRVRKAFGGGMRQAGILAAAGLMALKEGPARLAADHARAQTMARFLAGCEGFEIDPSTVTTNIVIAGVSFPPETLVQALSIRNVRALAVGRDRIRFVIHRDIHDRHVDRWIEAIGDFVSARTGTPQQIP